MGKFCTNCGQEIDSNASFCINCGKNLKEDNISNVESNLSTSNVNKEQKSKIAAGLLAIFLGSLGVHNFYLGYKNKAITQLLISLLSFGILSFVSSLWSLIEGILILTGSINVDANGNPLGD